MTKMADLRRRLPEIARLRLKGATWPDVAEFLAEQGLAVSANELRPYWSRLAGERHPAEILLDLAEARAEEAERQAAASKEFANFQLRSVSVLAGVAKEVKGLRARVDVLTKRNEELEAVELFPEGAANALRELKSLREEVGELRRRNAELDTVVARTAQLKRRSVEKAAEKAEEVERLRRQITDLQERTAELEKDKTRAEEAGRWAETGAGTFEALSDMLVGQQKELKAEKAELEADLRAVDMMSLGLGVGRKTRRQLRRYIGT
jgi:DNA repair exonuclease SbcCD ATPase subunit